MSAILPLTKVDNDRALAKFFMPHQIHWIQAEDAIRAAGKQTYALAEKSIRIGWTYADAFKNVRKRLRFKKRDYLFATKDYPSALEFIRLCKEIAELFNLTRSIVSHGEEACSVPRLDERGRSTGFTEELKMGVIKFDNGSRILAFSSHPQAMAVYAGDVGLDEFAKHPNARLLWETAQGRITWGYDIGVWSSHDGEDTLFNEFVQKARAGAPPWNLFYRVTITDAIELGLLDVINRVQGTRFTPDQFLSDCQARAGLPEVFEQSYMCNPAGDATNHIVDWSVIERCRYDYPIARVHLEHAQIIERFGEFIPNQASNREHEIGRFLLHSFNKILTTKSTYRLGFDVAASGQGNLAAIYIDEVKGNDLWLRALFTCRTEDWHFLKTVLFYFLRMLRNVQAAGDETGLGRQICWEASEHFPSVFTAVNFASEKHDLGFTLMNQLATAQKRFPHGEQDIAADYFALRKAYSGTKWIFSEGPNPLNPASHCDIAWAGALATHAHAARRFVLTSRLG
jgi:phage FluMu gp28-like protein